MVQNLINCLYSHFKESSKKLKIVCDWDEVIQPHEPYALWKIIDKPEARDFVQFFRDFWIDNGLIEYSPYGSRLLSNNSFAKEQNNFKNSLEFYQEAPFLTIAKELLKLIREGKVEKLIFLSAYDKRKFPNRDSRKIEIVGETFGKFPFCSLQLIGFESETSGVNKADWISQNASDFDLVIDDNPFICKKVKEAFPTLTVCAPYYPSIKNKHDERVLLIKTSVSDLSKENF